MLLVILTVGGMSGSLLVLFVAFLVSKSSVSVAKFAFPTEGSRLVWPEIPDSRTFGKMGVAPGDPQSIPHFSRAVSQNAHFEGTCGMIPKPHQLPVFV